MSILQGGHAPYTEREARGFQKFWNGVQGPNVAAPPSIQTILVRQELPYHPGSMLRPGIFGPDVNISITNRILLTQERPFHPGSQFFVFPPTPKVSAVARPLLTMQEQPFHPGSRFHAGTPPLSYEDVQVFLIH